ncbi:MAG: terpene cyclase/mutase family protein [Lentisphaeraceae bacterium]|nr:terpene cyclase/mutase family protein [Lentisphaeraceae bacterium]
MNSGFQFDQEFFSSARKGFRSLPEQEQNEIRTFVENSISEKGFFTAESGKEDIYTSAFGVLLCALTGVDKNEEAMTKYLRSKGDGEGMDFLHVVSLARAWRFYPHDSLEIGSYNKIAEKLEYNRCADKMWNQARGTHFGSVYGTFLAIAAYQDLGLSVPEEMKLIEGLRGLRCIDGAFGTDKSSESSTTPATAFALLILNFLEESHDYEISWLLKQQHSDGGFLAVSQMPFSDIQSTVYTVMALSATESEELADIAPKVTTFIESMKVKGGYRGHLKEEKCSIENTIFALAGLGFLQQ